MFSFQIDLAKFKLYTCRYWKITIKIILEKTTKKIVFDEEFSSDKQTE